MNKILFYVVISLFFLVQPVFGQEWKNVQFSNLSTDKGLSQSSVTRIFQDSRGFIWFGTRSGLNRWDGVNFKTYFFRDSLGVNDNHVLSICEDKHGNLWIGTSYGLNLINYQTGEIKSYFTNKKNPHSIIDNSVYALTCDKKGQLWVGTESGVDIYDEKKDRFRHISLGDMSRTNIIRSIVQTRKGTMLIATLTRGIIELDETGRILNNYNRKDGGRNNAAVTQIYAMCETDDDKIWVGCSNSELWEITDNDINCYKIPSAYADESFNLRTIVCDKSGNLLIGTNNGLFLFNTKTCRFTSFSELSVPSGNLNHFSVLDVKIDNAGTLWVGTYAAGVSFFNPYNTKFTYYNPIGMYLSSLCILGEMVEDGEGNIWMISEGAGLICLDMKKRAYSFYGIKPVSSQNSSRNIIKSIYKDGDILYCGTTKSEVYSFNLKTRQFKLFCRLPGLNKVIYEIIKDSSGGFWIGGTGEGGCLYRISASGKDAESVNVGEPQKDWNVRSILEVRKDIFLVGTRYDGFFLLNMKKKEKKQFSTFINGNGIMSSNYVTDIYQSKNKEIWITTFGGGIYLFRESGGLVHKYAAEQGLYDQNVCSITESLDGKLWLGNSSSISEFDPATGNNITYNNKEGIHLLELTPKGILRSHDGQIFFSGSNGFISFRPNEIKINQFIPPLYITSLAINNKEVTPNDKSAILKKNIECISEIDLSYNQNNLTITFSALNYIYAEHNAYKVKLESVNDDWIDIASQNYVNYVNLPPGNYVFKVKASNNDGVWNDQPAELKITINPPYWKTWWAYTLYFLLILGIVVKLFRMQKKKLELENQYNIEKMERDKVLEYHNQSVQSYTYFSHELRTPLSLILAPITDLINRAELLPSTYKDSLQMIHKNANRLLLLVNQLMDFRKTESNNLKLRVSESDFIVFMTDIFVNFKELAKSHNIELRFCSTVDSLNVYFDISLFEKLFFNLLSNALKFTKTGGVVKIQVSVYPNETSGIHIPDEEYFKIKELEGPLLYVSIEDDGVGIAKEDLDKIFNPFFRTENTEQKTLGSGIGLSLAKSIVKLSKGIIWVDSELGKGTKFLLMFPIVKENFQANELIDTMKEGVREEPVAYTIPVATSYKHTVLIVEDDEDLLFYLSNLLLRDFHLLKARNGLEGWEIASKELPDLIISDVMMPKMNGIDLCRKIKSDINTGHIPVVLLTSMVLNMQIQEGFSAGADVYLTKPFQSSELMMRIGALLNSRENLRKVYSKRFSLESLGIEVVSSDDVFMEQLNKIIQSHFSDPDLDINVIAKAIGMSRSNLYRKVRALTDDSTVNLIRNIRLRAAKELLEKSDYSISDIAIQTGFNSTAYFITNFKKQYAITPKEYQLKHR